MSVWRYLIFSPLCSSDWHCHKRRILLCVVFFCKLNLQPQPRALSHEPWAWACLSGIYYDSLIRRLLWTLPWWRSCCVCLDLPVTSPCQSQRSERGHSGWCSPLNADPASVFAIPKLTFKDFFFCCWGKGNRIWVLVCIPRRPTHPTPSPLLSRSRGLNFTCQSEEVVFTSVSVTPAVGWVYGLLSPWLWVVSPKLSITAGGLCA